MILLVDGNNLSFVHNAIGSLSTRDGFPTQAIVGFLKALRACCIEFKPRRIFVCWDGGKSRRRMELCPEYKANRSEGMTPEKVLMLEDFRKQVPVIQSLIVKMGIHSLFGHGVEGDDIIAMMAATANRVETDAVILSSDRDFLQLVNDRVSLYLTTTPKKGAPRLLTPAEVIRQYGVRPDQFLDYKCLTGDGSDNIEGIKGIGPKTAAKILNEHGTIEKLVAAIQGGSLKKSATLGRILDGRPLIERNRKMMGLHDIDPGELTGVRMTVEKPDNAWVRSEFRRLEMKDPWMNFPIWMEPFNCLWTRRNHDDDKRAAA